MPIYQYECSGCGRRVEILFRSVSKVGPAVCPGCGSRDLRRAVSQVARARSDRERLDSIDPAQELGRLESGDVAGFARWARRVGRAYDGELGSDFTTLAEQAEAGEDPIERVDPAHTLRSQIRKRRDALSGDATGGAGPADGV
jgi:putative FmdB family regulatory protein